ncbi:MAG TPA: M36 family metallopeptidase [Actinomycetota bacterium]
MLALSASGLPSAARIPVQRQRDAARETADQARSFDSRRAGAPVGVPSRVARARALLASDLGSQAIVASDPVTGTARFVGRLDGFLTARSARPAESIALDYVRSRLAAFGLSRADLGTLELRRDYVDILGTHHLSWVQRAGGLPVFGAGLMANVTADGRLVNVSGSPVPGLRPITEPAALDATSAIVAARSAAGGDAAREEPDTAERVLFPTARGVRLAWKTITRISNDRTDLAIVDAETGGILWRTNLTSADSVGTGIAVEYYPGGDVPLGGGEPHEVTFPVLDGTKLLGNNAHVFADVNDDDEADPGDEIPALSGLDWSYVPVFDTTTASQNCSTHFYCTWDATTPRSWRANRKHSGVQLFHFLNTYHDHLEAAPIGFTEAAGNFQIVNESGLGLGGDPVEGQFMDGANLRNGLPDGSHVNNANMTTLPDGSSPVMQVFLAKAAGYAPLVPTSDSSDEAETVYHEYGHGLSARLVTFPDGTPALAGPQGGAMDEGGADWYAIDFTDNQGYFIDTPTPGDAIIFRYGSGDQIAYRTEATDCPVGVVVTGCEGTAGAGPGGYTYGDYGRVVDTPEVHADGEIWTQTLWDIREALGSDVAETVVTRGMELSPPDPTFLDMRNAIIQADLIAFAGDHTDALWSLFAARGMGFFAATTGSGDPAPIEDFSLPVACDTDPCGSISGTVTDATTGEPIEGISVFVAGLASGFTLNLSDTTDASGAYSIADVPFHDYPKVVVEGAGFEPFVVPIDVDGDETLDAELFRDWAALEGGARLLRASPPDYSGFCGFGADGAFDLTLGAGWPSDSPSNDDSGVDGPRSVVVRLPVVVDVTSFGVASGGTCGDGPNAGVKGFTFQVRGHRSDPWSTVLMERARADGVLRSYAPTGNASNVRFVRFIMRSNHGQPNYMDVLEVTVRGT